jgi:hypothetical protein
MKPESPPPAPTLSLQNKLDRIAHERDVLALLRELARHGLREGDTVRHAADGRSGRLQIARDEHPPNVIVALEDGSVAPYSAAFWHHH